MTNEPPVHRLDDGGVLHDPLLIAAFASGAGATAAATLHYLVEQWEAIPFADIDPDPFYDFTVLRPVTRLREDGTREVQWPSNRVYLARPHGATRDVLLLPGIEPHVRWQAFSEAVAGLALEAGVSTVLTLSTHAGGAPHTRPTPVLVATADAAAAQLVGVPVSPPSDEGAVGIGDVLADALARHGVAHVGVRAMTPFYIAGQLQPEAMIALVDAVDRTTGAKTPLDALREQAAETRRMADEAVAQNQPLRETVRNLEQQYDFIRGQAPAALSAPVEPDLPDAAALVEHLDEFLRGRGDSEQRQSGGAARA